MKKILLLFVIVSMFVSCQKETTVSDTKWNVVNFGINQTNWVRSVDSEGLNPYYSCLIDMPEITPYIYNQGIVQIYIVFDGVQQVLPFVRHNEDIDGAQWTQTIDADFAAGSIEVKVIDSDFSGSKPSAMDFRVVLLW